MGKRLLECFFTGKAPGEGNRAEKQKHRNKKNFAPVKKKRLKIILV
jgi:ribosomal protein L28